ETLSTLRDACAGFSRTPPSRARQPAWRGPADWVAAPDLGCAHPSAVRLDGSLFITTSVAWRLRVHTVRWLLTVRARPDKSRTNASCTEPLLRNCPHSARDPRRRIIN